MFLKLRNMRFNHNRVNAFLLASAMALLVANSEKGGIISTAEASNNEKAEKVFVNIATGKATGVYYQVGNVICKYVNKSADDNGLSCNVESTDGSIANLNAIKRGDTDLGVAQSDWQYHSYNGSSVFEKDGPNNNLRSVFAVHSESFTVLARKDSGITKFEDLKGKRVNIGNPGSGQRGTMEVLMTELGWTKADFKFTSELNASEQAQALCDNKVDAIVFVVGHRNGSIQNATTSCESVLVEVSGSAVEKLISENSYYRSSIIPGGLYKGNPDDVATFGVAATFVTSASVSDQVVYSIVKTVFENLESVRKFHEAFKYLQPEEMIKDGLSAPLHPGAEKYYREIGLTH